MLTFKHGQTNKFERFSADDELKIDSGGDDDFDDMDDSVHNNSNRYSSPVLSSQQTQPHIQTSMIYKSI